MKSVSIQMSISRAKIDEAIRKSSRGIPVEGLSVRQMVQLGNYISRSYPNIKVVYSKEFKEKLEEEKRKMRFKVGDLVRVRKNMRSGFRYGDAYTNSLGKMNKYFGHVYEVEKVDEVEGKYYLAGVSNDSGKQWAWNDVMLEPVEKELLSGKELLEAEWEICEDCDNICNDCPLNDIGCRGDGESVLKNYHEITRIITKYKEKKEAIKGLSCKHTFTIETTDEKEVSRIASTLTNCDILFTEETVECEE